MDLMNRSDGRWWTRRRIARACIGGVVAVVLLSPMLDRDEPGRAKGTYFRRLFEPLSTLAAGVQWVRVQSAIGAGEHELALARAETALALDPSSAAGWRSVAYHLGLHLGSHEREADPERRLALLRAALAVLERGDATAGDRAALAFARGVLFYVHAEQDAELPWPGGTRELWREAADAFDRAVELGHGEAADLARDARSHS